MRLPAVTRRFQMRVSLVALGGVALTFGGAFIPWGASWFMLAGLVAWLGGGAVACFAIWKRTRDIARGAERCWRDRQDDAARQLRATSRGDTLDAIRSDALRQAAALFGPGCELEICAVEDISTAIRTDKGAFRAVVTVRMLPGSPVTTEKASQS